MGLVRRGLDFDGPPVVIACIEEPNTARNVLRRPSGEAGHDHFCYLFSEPLSVLSPERDGIAGRPRMGLICSRPQEARNPQ